MEGIIPPFPWTAARATLSVPYLSQALYQPRSSSFESFLQHYGFQRADHAGDLIHGCETIASLTVFLQSWLFFGLLSAFLERDINREDFVTGDVVDINQEAVHVYFRDWRVSLSRFSYTARRKKQERIQMLLQTASLKSDVFEEAADFLGPNHDDFDRVILSIKLLVSLLSAIADDTFAVINPPPSRFWAPWVTAVASCIVRSHPTAIQYFKVPDEYLSESLAVIGEQEARRHLHSQPNRFRPYPPGVERGGRAAERLLRIFIDNGWCPYRALNLCQSYDYLILNSLASLIHNPPVAENHQHCLELQKCTAHNLMVDGPTEYPFQHVDEPHDCEFVGVTRDQIAEIIKSDQIPLISMSLEGDLDLQVVQCTPYTTYTAISHVWSDGLGNPYSNALPRCQLLRLRRLISETYFAKYSPFYDDSTSSSQFASTLYWEFWRGTRASKPYYKVDKKRVYFWMDTLCIPVSADLQMAEEDRDLKFRAMKHITPVFAGAFTTLVLDRGLQTVQLQEPSQVSGDEFAAIILSSKWMLRGWTLEEGVLSSTCVFQMMDKPYEISGSLNHLMPKLAAQRSPLERVSINVRRLMPLVLKRALVDEKKKLSGDPLASRAKRLTKLLRVPQFTWTWNSLLHRSMTKEQDGPIILANLVDFNVSGLKFVPPEERLKLLIQSCDELPLSLLYNTGPRVSIKGRPELGWIPRSISGDHIVSGAAFRRITTKRTDNHVKFFIDRQDSDPESFLVLETPPGQCIPYDTATFVVRARIGIHGNLVQEYVVEIQRSLCEGLDDEDARSFDRQLYQQAQGTCIAMDLACGTSSWRGISGKGVRFYVDSHQRKQMNLKYDAPLIIRTAEQWQRTYNRHQASLPCFDMTYVRRSQRLLLKYDASLWGQRLIRRPFLTQHPLGAKTTGLFVFLIILLLVIVCLGYLFVTIRGALGFRQTVSPHSLFFLWIFAPLCTIFIYHPIRRRLAMYTYISWLKSFDDGYVGPKSRRKVVSSFISRSIGRASSLWRQPPRGVSRVNISLPSVRGREDSEAEFPGDIFLECAIDQEGAPNPLGLLLAELRLPNPIFIGRRQEPQLGTRLHHEKQTKNILASRSDTIDSDFATAQRGQNGWAAILSRTYAKILWEG